MSPIQADGASTDFEMLTGVEDDGVDAFLSTFLPPDALKKKEPSEGKTEKQEDEQPEEKTEDTDENSDESPEKTEGDEEGSEDEKEAKRKYVEDEGVYVKIKVGDEEHEVPVKDLNRLWGQEAALTQKSQQVADERKKIEGEVQKNVAASSALLERARSRFEPYSKVDFLLAAQQLSPEEYTALRNEATKAWEDVQFLEKHVDAYAQQLQQNQQVSLRERAVQTLKELGGEDPAKSIPGWSEKTYNELREYATSKLDVPPDVMNNLVDSWGLRVLHKAMLYDKGKANVVTTKVNKTPKTVIKTTTTPAASKSTANSANKAFQKLKQSGSTDDAAEAFLARWGDDND